MAGNPRIGGLEIEITAGVDRFDRSLVQAERRAKNAGTTMAREFDRAEGAAGRLQATLNRGVSSLALFGASFGAGALVKGIIEAADSMQLLRGRISNVIGESESLNRVQRDLYNSAQQNRVSLEATAALYLRMRQAVRDLNHEQALTISSTFAKTLTLSGASASEAASSMLQFAQSMSKGKLDGDELKSILENNSRFARLLGDALGVTSGQLRDLGEAGALTGDLVGKALSGQAATIEAEFANVPVTVGQAFQQLQNGLLMYVSNVDQSFGVSARIAKGIQMLTDNIEDLANALIILSAALAAAGVGAGLTFAAKQAAIFGTAVTQAFAAFQGDTAAGRAIERLRKFQDGLHKVNGELAVSKASALAASAAFRSVNSDPQATRPDRNNARAALENAGVEVERQLHRQKRLTDAIIQQQGIVDRLTTGFANRARQFGGALLNAGQSLVNFFGGPVGLAILTLSAAAAVLTATALEAERVKRSVQSGLEIVAGLNIDVSKAAADATKNTNGLTSATDAQTAAVKALNEQRREGLRLELQKSVNDARTLRDSAANRVRELQGLNNAPFTGQGLKDFRQPMIEAAQADLDRVNKSLPILEAGLKAVTDGVADFGDTTQKEMTDAERALDLFNKGIEAQRKSINDPKLKSTLTKNLLDTLAGKDLALARQQFPKVRDLLSDTDAIAVEKNFLKIARASVELKTSLSEFATDAEKFKKAIKDIAAADPAEGNKSRAALQAVLEYGKELKNLPDAFRAIENLKLTPADAELARKELTKIAEAGATAFGTEAQQQAAAYGEALAAINDAEDALKATGSSAYDPQVFEAARALLRQDLTDKQRLFAVDDFEELSDLIREMLTPAEKLAEELAEIENLREGAGALGNQALDRKRVSLLADEARAAGLARDALRQLETLRQSAGLSNSQVREQAKGIKDAAAAGREGMRWDELSSAQQSEAAAHAFATSFTEALTQGIRSGNFGEAVRDVIANKAAEALTDSIMRVGETVGDMLFGGSGLFSSMLGGTGEAAALGQKTAAELAAAGAAVTLTSALGLLSSAVVAAASVMSAGSSSSIVKTGIDILDNIPGFARGGAGRGVAIVGEEGPELVNLGSSAYVTPNHALRGAMAGRGASAAGGGGNFYAGDVIVQGDVGTQAQLNELREIQAESARNFNRNVRAVAAAQNKRQP